MLGQICISSCPTGYKSSSSVCIISTNPIITITLNSIEDKVNDTSSNISFSTGPDTNFYPTGVQGDPIPAIQRGYYFKSTSYMTSAAFILPYNFTMIFYIKHLSGGVILTKGDLTISSLDFLNFTINSVINASFPTISTTD